MMVLPAAVLALAGLLLVLPSLAQGATADPIAWPEANAQSRPWTRWWWLGSAVDEKTLSQLLEQYRDAGIGGVEICPIYGARGYEERYVRFLSPRWMDLLAHVTSEGQRLGVGVDLTDGTGWPFGGAGVSSENASAKIVLKAYDGVPEQLPEGLLQCVMAVSEAGKRVDVTGKVVDRRLDWNPPAGKWRIYAASLVSPIQKVKRAAPGGEGDVLDPYSVGAIDRYLAGFDRAFEKFAASKPRAHFHDSFEYYGANWTRGFFEQFRDRRGYDLREQLPALMGEGDPDVAARVQCDYRETISDLHLAYVSRWNEWCHKQGGLSREQAHGAPGNLLDLYAAADIPETETFGEIDPRWFVMHKLASSAAHVSGRNLSSCESFTWLGEHFSVSLAEAKQAADYIFLTGANHLFFHGVSYSPPDAAWPGWLFYASVNFGPNGGLWRDLPAFNAYLTRCQSILQSGRSDNDLLLYFPIHDLWQKPGNLIIQLGMHSQEKWLWPQSFDAAGKLLNDRGYTFDAVSDRLLDRAVAKDGRVELGGGKYAAIVVPNCRVMPPATARKLADLARGGARIVVMGELPSDVPGFGELEARRGDLQRATEALKAMDGTQLFVGPDLRPLLEQLKVRREAMVDQGLSFVRRAREAASDYFIVNRSAKPVDGWVTLATPVASAVLMDPRFADRAGVAAVRGGDEVYLQLKSGESCILRTFNQQQVDGRRWEYLAPGDAVALTGTWRVRFVDGGPDLPKDFEKRELASWISLGDAKAMSFAGTARYEIEFDAPFGDGEEVALDLGKVCESARVTLNGTPVATLIAEPFEVYIGAGLKPGRNKLEVEVTNLAANRIADLDRRGVQWKSFHEVNFVNKDYKPFDASKWPARDSGLLGPVRIIRMKRVNPTQSRSSGSSSSPDSIETALNGAMGS